MLGSKTAWDISTDVGDVIKVGEDIYVIPIIEVMLLVNLTAPQAASGTNSGLSAVGLGIPLAFLVVWGERVEILPLVTGYFPSSEITSCIMDKIKKFAAQR